MRNKLFGISLIIAIGIFSASLLAGCDVSSSSSSAASSSTASDSSSTSTSVVCPDVDYAATTKLNLDYVGHVFLTEGIGKVTLNETVDGDTVHFYECDASGAATKTKIAARFLCIDTPESTGKIEPWGHPASVYTSELVTSAKTLVLSSILTYYSHAAIADSTGSRFLSYVWISDTANAAYADLRLLNLMIVMEGFSTTKSATDSIYYQAFYDADQQAQCQDQHIWGSKPDPSFIYSDAVGSNLYEINEGLKYNNETGVYDQYDWTDATHNKVSFACTVSMTVDGNAYVYDDATVDGEAVRFGLYIFAGYRNISPLTHVGWKLVVVGWITSFNGNLQATGVSYSALYPTSDDIVIVDRTDVAYVASVKTIAELVGPDSARIADPRYNVVSTVNGLHGVTGYGTYADSDEGAFTIKCYDAAGNSIRSAWKTSAASPPNSMPNASPC